MGSDTVSWAMPSGLWRQADENGTYVLDRLPDGAVPAAQIPPADLYRLAGAAADRQDDPATRRYPPEFRFAPDSGRRLETAAIAATRPWMAPFGEPPLEAGRPATELRGLCQTAMALRPAARRAASATDDAPHQRPLPPPGAYEFIVGRHGAACDVLVAFEPDKGALFAWLDKAAQWVPIEPQERLVLAESPLKRDAWRAEWHAQGGTAGFVVPTAAGLAVLTLDVLSLSYRLKLVGGGRAVGAPIAWADDVWMPLQTTANGRTTLQLATAGGRCWPVDLPPPEGGFAAPVCDARVAIWPCAQGQLVVRLGGRGEPDCSWQPWPAGATPSFGFGSPHVSRSGSFWQLCWDEAAGSYLYVQMGRAQPEVQPVSAPRMCSGHFSYKLGARLAGDPWLDPEYAYDASSTEVVLPIVESPARHAALGFAVDAPSGLSALLESSERQRSVLLYQDDASELRFFTLMAARPWRARVVVHEGRLWLYHPDVARLHGWDLERA